MSSSTDLSASVVTKLNTFTKRGEQRLAEIDAMLRRLGVESLNTGDLDIEGASALSLVADEAKHQAIGKAQTWVDDLDEYAKGYLPGDVGARIRRHPDGRGADTAAALIDNIRIAVRSRMDTVRHLVGFAVPTPAGAERDANGGWPHLRELGLIEDAVLDGYLKTMRTRRTVADRRAAIAAAKELLEAVMKGAIRYADPAAEGFEKAEMQDLWKKLRELIQEDPAVSPGLGRPDFGVSKMLKAMGNIVIGMAETRNNVGYGHGNPEAPRGLRESHTLMVIDSTHTLTRFIASRLNEVTA